MAKTYSIAQARAMLPTLVDAAAAGQDIELTRRGKPVAVVVSIPVYERLQTNRLTFAVAYRQFRERYQGVDIAVPEGHFESGREKGSGRKVRL